jgi:hypothetical protein
MVGDDVMLIADYIALIVLLSLIGVAQLSRNASQRGCARPQNRATIIETITPITIKALVQSIFGRNSAIHCHRGLGLLIVAHLNNRWRLVSLVMFNGLVNAQSSSASRVTAGAFGFLTLIQCGMIPAQL